jgi:hypothetical protein
VAALIAPAFKNSAFSCFLLYVDGPPYRTPLPPPHCRPASRFARRTASTEFGAYPSAPICAANCALTGAPPTMTLHCARAP